MSQWPQITLFQPNNSSIILLLIFREKENSRIVLALEMSEIKTDVYILITKLLKTWWWWNDSSMTVMKKEIKDKKNVLTKSLWCHPHVVLSWLLLVRMLKERENIGRVLECQKITVLLLTRQASWAGLDSVAVSVFVAILVEFDSEKIQISIWWWNEQACQECLDNSGGGGLLLTRETPWAELALFTSSP